jgi:selenide,water dikinase
LQALLAPVRLPDDPRVLVNSATADDAGVVKLRDDIALVLTVDFFPPMVDDPVWFGRIGAANSLSDVYAMGGIPHSAVAIFSIPDNVPEGVPADIINGAIEKCSEAGAALVGGHTVTDTEIKFGLAVTGEVHPDRIVSNAGARPGDALVLTKPLGSGYLCTAIKRGVLDAEETLRTMEVLAALNRPAADAMREVGVNAATDITGFGLVGHAIGMAYASGVSIRLIAANAPWIEGLDKHITRKNTCGGLNRNRAYADADGRVRWSGGTDEQQAVLVDPQTSGGLLLSVPPARLGDLLAELEARGVATRAVVGEVLMSQDFTVEVI